MNTYYDHGVWRDLDPSDIIPGDAEPVIAWNITCKRNPWLSLGVHIDHKWPLVELHLPGLLVRAGRQDHWGGERGLLDKYPKNKEK